MSNMALSVTNRDNWKSYFSEELDTRARIEAGLKQENHNRLMLSFKQEEYYNTRRDQVRMIQYQIFKTESHIFHI